MKHTLIVLMGVSAAGKTTLAKYIKDNHEDCVIISRDSIRFAMLQEGDDYFKYEKRQLIKRLHLPHYFYIISVQKECDEK